MRPLTLGDERCMFRRVQVQRHREYSRQTLFGACVGLSRLVDDSRKFSYWTCETWPDPND